VLINNCEWIVIITETSVVQRQGHRTLNPRTRVRLPVGVIFLYFSCISNNTYSHSIIKYITIRTLITNYTNPNPNKIPYLFFKLLTIMLRFCKECHSVSYSTIIYHGRSQIANIYYKKHKQCLELFNAFC
jgi:hypothetical protein